MTILAGGFGRPPFPFGGLTLKQQLVRMVALKKQKFGYGYQKRVLEPGEDFLCKASDARVWIHMKAAKEAPIRPKAEIPAPPADLLKKVEEPEPVAEEAPEHWVADVPAVEEEVVPLVPRFVTVEDAEFTASGGELAESTVETDLLAETRADYQLKLGKKPYHGWDVEELRRRISEAE